jgi:lysophospholipase L1-like esterase
VDAPRPHWQLGLLAGVVIVGGIVTLELGLRALSLVPPDSPALFHARTHDDHFSPFVAGPGGDLVIRPDWVNAGEGMRGRVGRRAGRQFLFPGFRPVRLAREKPAGAVRIFALGGSTTFGLYVGAEHAFAAALERQLRERLPGRDVRVVNLGCAGFASDRVAGLLEVVLDLEPDLVIVYTGHNEMLGGEVGATAVASPGLRLRIALLRSSVLFAWLDHAIARTLRAAETEKVAEEVAALEAGHIPTFIPEAVPESQRVPPGEAFRARAAAGYREQLRRMIAAGKAAGVPLLFVHPAANLLTRPIPVHPQGFDQQAVFDGHLRAAEALGAAGKIDEALARLEQAQTLSPGYASVYYRRGELLARAGRLEEARAAYQRAIDTDLRTYRMTSPLHRAFRESVAEGGVASLDVRPIFDARLDFDTAHELFVDHLHPTAEGHARIAKALLPEVLRLLGLPAGEADQSGASSRASTTICVASSEKCRMPAAFGWTRSMNSSGARASRRLAVTKPARRYTRSVWLASSRT